MIDDILLILGISLVTSFSALWICVIPFIIASISKNTKRSADESEKIRHTLDNIEKDLKQLSESLKK